MKKNFSLEEQIRHLCDAISPIPPHSSPLLVKRGNLELQKKDVSEENAPASLKSSFVSTLYMRWGRALE